MSLIDPRIVENTWSREFSELELQAIQELLELYGKVSALFSTPCGKCPVSFRCCTVANCVGLAASDLKDRKIPYQYPETKYKGFMTSSGCSLPAYLRTVCSEYVCSVGLDHSDWMEKKTVHFQRIAALEKLLVEDFKLDPMICMFRVNGGVRDPRFEAQPKDDLGDVVMGDLSQRWNERFD